MNRRSFLLGLAAGLAPAVIRTPGLLMPVKALVVPEVAQTLIVSHRHWFNMMPGRIEEALSRGYRVVTDGSGEPITQIVGTDASGGVQAALLMELGRSWSYPPGAYAPIVEG